MAVKTTHKTGKSGAYYLTEYRDSKGRLFLSEGETAKDAELGIFELLDNLVKRLFLAKRARIQELAHG